MHDRCALVLALMVCGAPAEALTIRELPRLDDVRVIALEGRFEPGDDAKFRDFIIGIERAVIVLASPGGRLEPALEIGWAIRKNRFATLVHGGSQCASACALVWLGGVARAMGQDAKLGFHGAHVLKEGQAVRSDAGNARVAAYLARLKLSDRVIQYVTEAAPHDFNWLSFEAAESLEIVVKRASPAGVMLPAGAPTIRKGDRLGSSTAPVPVRVQRCQGAWECWDKYGGQAPAVLTDLVAAYAGQHAGQ
jgi:hypothetical protein